MSTEYYIYCKVHDSDILTTSRYAAEEVLNHKAHIAALASLDYIEVKVIGCYEDSISDFLKAHQDCILSIKDEYGKIGGSWISPDKYLIQ
jgi:hypothetical protein